MPRAMPLVLLPGLRLVRRDPGHLQLGVDLPRMAVLPDLPEVRRLVDDLAAGRPPGDLSAVGTRALTAIVSAGLAVPANAEGRRRELLARAPVRVEASRETFAALGPMLAASGVVAAAEPDAVAALVVADTELARGRLDPLVRDGVPHLVVGASQTGFTVGPFVVPGATACVRCVDAHRSEGDPRRALVVEQVASEPPLTRARPDQALRSIALGWAVRDLVTFLEGGRPATWSATLHVEAGLRLVPHSWLRHSYCGCSWGNELPVAVG